jgi:hypothetical protein
MFELAVASNIFSADSCQFSFEMTWDKSLRKGDELCEMKASLMFGYRQEQCLVDR